MKKCEKSNSPTPWKLTFILDWNFFDQLWRQKRKLQTLVTHSTVGKWAKKNARSYSRDFLNLLIQLFYIEGWCSWWSTTLKRHFQKLVFVGKRQQRYWNLSNFSPKIYWTIVAARTPLVQKPQGSFKWASHIYHPNLKLS